MGSPQKIAQDVIDKLQVLDEKINTLLEERVEMKSSMKKLEAEKEQLQKEITNTRAEIKVYLKELEQIKSHYYVNSNHNA